MRILVTGTSGRVGSVVARHFVEQGYTVRALDNRPLPGDLRGKVEAVYEDLCDPLAMLRVMEGCDAVAHNAAIPAPMGNDADLMRINVLGTYHLFAAAEAYGVKRFALASTCCAFGIFFAHHPWDPHYLPMDEKHPALPQDMYALSKRCNEETAAAFTRRCGMTTVALRLTTVMNFASVSPWTRRWLRNDEDRRNDLWSYIEVTDVARAYQCAIEKAQEGTHTTAIIAARDSFTTHDIRHLVQKHFPARTGDVADLAPTQSLYDTGVAEEAFGFVARRNWREVPELHGDSA